MRRCFSISVIVALISTFAPMNAMRGCHPAGGPMVCHRTAAMHHCDEMDNTDQADDSGDARYMSAGNPVSKCPMNCCFHVGSSSTAMALVHHSVFVLVSVRYDWQPASTVFTSNGFSSHTDRGPPSLS
jgi:hypothetical protein